MIYTAKWEELDFKLGNSCIVLQCNKRSLGYKKKYTVLIKTPYYKNDDISSQADKFDDAQHGYESS